MSAIANLGQVTDSLDTAAKFFRVMGNEEGVILAHFVYPMNDLKARANLGAYLKAGCPVFVVPPAPEPPPLLVFDDTHVASVDISGAHDPDAFWRDTKEAPARYVWPGFRKHVVARASAMVAQKRDIIKMPWADTSRGTTVREVLATPGVGDHSPTILAAVIATMIARQSNGEFLKNGLLNDGRGNLFRCGSVLVNVRWRDDYREWCVYDWDPVLAVDPDRRVFSGNLIL